VVPVTKVIPIAEDVDVLNHLCSPEVQSALLIESLILATLIRIAQEEPESQV
jgi:hypothetical protein